MLIHSGLLRIIVTSLFVPVLAGCSLASYFDKSRALEVGGPSRVIPVKLVNNEDKKGNKTWFLVVPAEVHVNCDQGPVSLTFKIVGNTDASFLDPGPEAIVFENPGVVIGASVRKDAKTVVVNDLCSDKKYYKYEVYVNDPGGVEISLDPLIKNF